jgi:hypothetical protein
MAVSSILNICLNEVSVVVLIFFKLLLKCISGGIVIFFLLKFEGSCREGEHPIIGVKLFLEKNHF